VNKYIYNENAFKTTDDPETAYWLGFMFADGCIFNQKNKWSAYLSITDLDVMIQFKKYLETDQKIKIIDNGISKVTKRELKKTYKLNICDQKICNNLINLGMYQNKTYTLTFPKHINNINHFIRGYFDGDGCISLNVGKNTRRLRFNIIGTYDMVYNIQQHLIKELNISKTKLYNPKSSPSIWSLQIVNSEDIIKLKNYLYKDTNVYMLRKYEIFNIDVNIKINDNCTSQYKNISYRKSTNRWRASFYENDIRKEKTFKTELDAYNFLKSIEWYKLW